MKRIPDEVYLKMNHSVYNTDEINWWHRNSPFNLIETILNPVRINYFIKVITRLKLNAGKMTALEVGCGGGILAEQIAGVGFQTTGIDPAARSIAAARAHAGEKNLSINYQVASGERLPFADQSFDVVFCCDVLEHVRDFAQVISEISRVMKHGGTFFYDTINRTFFSWLIVIKVMQEWNCFSVLPSRLHVWEMFIRPGEIRETLAAHQLQWQEHRGIMLDGSGLKTLRALHQMTRGKISPIDFSQECRLKESGFLEVAYMGYAVK